MAPDAPANIEAALRESRWISDAVVFGDGHSYLVGIVSLDPEEAAALAREFGLEPDVSILARDQRVHDRLEEDVQLANQRSARIEQVKRFAISITISRWPMASSPQPSRASARWSTTATARSSRASTCQGR